MKFESTSGDDREDLNLIQEVLRLKPTYKQLFEEAKCFTQKVSTVRRDEKARKASVIESLYPQKPFEGLRVDGLALVRFITENKKPSWPYVGYDRWKEEQRREFRLFVERDLSTDEQTLPPGSLVVFRPRFTYLLEDVGQELFHDNDLDLHPISDHLPLSKAPAVSNTLESLETYTLQELLAADVGTVSLRAVFGSKEK